MAELLHRLGTFAARRAWTVLIAWIVILAAAVGGFLVGFKGLSSSFDIPGTASGEVVAELERELPDFAGATGTVVVHATAGAITDEQREQLAELIEGAESLPDVSGVNDPFATEAERADQAQQLEDGRAQLEAGQEQLDAGRAQLEAGAAALEEGQAQLDAARAQAEAAGFPTAQLDAQQAQLDAQRTVIDEQRAQLDEGQAELDEQRTRLERGEELLSLADGIRLVSEDGATALVTVSYTETRLELPQESKDATMAHFSSQPIDGLEISFSTDIAQGVPEILGIGEAIGVALAAVVLVVVLGSLLAAALPIVTALLGVAIGAMAVLSFSGVVQMASVTPILGVMLGLAVGIDYSLFIVYRHRKQLLRGMGVVESIGLANGTAGNAVVFAGVTVIVALLALGITGIPFLGLMGVAGAVSVAVAVLIATSATPALLGLAGRRILSRRALAKAEAASDGADALRSVRPMSHARAVLSAVLAVAVLATIAIPALSMRLGLPDGASEPADSTAYRAYALTEEAFGEGQNGPLLVTATMPGDLDDVEVERRQLAVASELAASDDVVAVAPVGVSDDERLAVFQVVPAEGPNSESTEALVRELRERRAIEGDMALGVAGQAASNIDISEGLADALPTYLAVVVGLSFLIMVMVFRSLLVPLIATGGFVLSLFATFGAVTAVFQWGWLGGLFGVSEPGPILSFLPVILTGILFGLAMDYQLFLTTGMREAYVHGADARLAVARGFRAGRSVVIAAALIMIAVFAGFIASESIIIKAMGFGLALGVLLDAFVVRMLLVPAIMHLVGRGAWWLPRWLDRIIPNVDVEGASLERRHPAASTGSTDAVAADATAER
ncbi:MMPL family transporter [Agrococcus sp. TF02-05]|uniref:MMPL family transporter n=1 Tax=Agrococcus sp. TF02-05 TaxID=2815211 RepID=UPI001AA10A1D|nr:MMPL family transporter [Agrococcus sp. TF02-05]MBO1769920.1 MMPL family transporter [Agrococcus sp. TF02-05]